MLKLYPPDDRHPTWRVRGTYLRTSVDRATGTTEKAVAQKLLKRWKDDIERGAYTRPEGPTWATAALSYVKNGKDKYFIGRLTEHFGNKLLETFTQNDIDEAASKLYPLGTPSTRNRAVYTPVMAVLNHAGFPCVRNAAGGLQKIRRPKGAQGESRLCWLTPDQADALIAAARMRAMRTGANCDRRFCVLLQFLLYTGLRLGEATSVRAVDLDLDRGFCYVGHTKNGQPRGVHLPPHLADELRRLPPRNNGRMFSQVRSFQLRELADMAGVLIPEGVAYHILRHTFGSWARRYGGLDTSGLVATGAWKSRSAAMVYEHADTTEEAR